jgi:hypothetical protein
MFVDFLVFLFFLMLGDQMKVSGVDIQKIGTGGGTTKLPPTVDNDKQKEKVSSVDTVTLSNQALLSTGGGTTKPDPK